MPKILNEVEKAKRKRRMAVAVSDEVYDGTRALAALEGKTVNDYIATMLEVEVQKRLPSIKKVLEAQKNYQQALIETITEKEKAAE